MSISKFYLDRIGIKYTLFTAIDGLNYKEEYAELTLRKFVDSKLGLNSPGSLGILKTWQALLIRAKEKGEKKILILEDDFILIKNFQQTLNTYHEVLQSKYNALYLGVNRNSTWTKEESDEVLSKRYYHPIKLIYGTFAIAIQDHHGFFDRLLNKISGYYGTIDTFVLNSLRQEDLATHYWKVLGENLIIADVSDSDNMGIREQETFCEARGWKLKEYDRIALNDFMELWNFIHNKQISLRSALATYPTNIGVNDLLEILSVMEPSGVSDKIFEQLTVFNRPGFVNKYHLYALFNDYEVIAQEKPFVFIIASYQNEDWVSKNLKSISNQEYNNFRIIYIDDSSHDLTYKLTKNLKKTNKRLQNRMTILRTFSNQGATSSRYLGLQNTEDEEIAVFLDGDDWLADSKVLYNLNKFYDQEHPNPKLISYGSYLVWSKTGCSSEIQGGTPFVDAVIEEKRYRDAKTVWRALHLRTGYCALFKRIWLKDLLHSDGKFYLLSTDKALMVPALEMAGARHGNVSDVLVIYNKLHSIALERESSEKLKDETNMRIAQGKVYETTNWNPQSLMIKAAKPSLPYLFLSSKVQLGDFESRETIELYSDSYNEYYKGPAFGKFNLFESRETAKLINKLKQIPIFAITQSETICKWSQPNIATTTNTLTTTLTAAATTATANTTATTATAATAPTANTTATANNTATAATVKTTVSGGPVVIIDNTKFIVRLIEIFSRLFLDYRAKGILFVIDPFGCNMDNTCSKTTFIRNYVLPRDKHYLSDVLASVGLTVIVGQVGKISAIAKSINFGIELENYPGIHLDSFDPEQKEEVYLAFSEVPHLK